LRNRAWVTNQPGHAIGPHTFEGSRDFFLFPNLSSFYCSTTFQLVGIGNIPTSNTNTNNIYPNTMMDRPQNPRDEKKRSDENGKKRKKKAATVRFGDSDFHLEELGYLEEAEYASCHEVVTTCCFHSLEDWSLIIGGIVLLMGCLYFFLFGLALLGDSAQVMAGCRAGELFNNESNPLSSLMTGILATVLMQSSSTTTGVIVSLVEAKVLDIEHGIYLVMGANIGTSVTSTIVSLAHIRNVDQLERAFTAGTVHDMFNFMTVAILFPLEIATGYLKAVTGVLVDGAETNREDHWEGPVKKFVSPLSKRLLISNKKLIQGVANGAECSDFYPIQCDEGLAPSYDTCKTGLIGCNKKTNE
jgi:sodium-dependent phosphate cotransporter